jgi:hypothetical protein
MYKNILKQKVVLVNLGIQKYKKLLSRDNIIQERSLNSINLIIIQILLTPLLSNLFYYSQGDIVFFLNTIRLLLVIKQVSISTLFAIEISKLVNGFRKGNTLALLLK